MFIFAWEVSHCWQFYSFSAYVRRLKKESEAITKIYIAGPYSKGDVAENVRNAVFAGNFIALRGHIPFIPHLTHFWHMLCPHPYEFWLSQDMEWLKECDAILRLERESPGAEAEIEYMKSVGKPVFHSVFDVPIIEGE